VFKNLVYALVIKSKNKRANMKNDILNIVLFCAKEFTFKCLFLYKDCEEKVKYLFLIV